MLGKYPTTEQYLQPLVLWCVCGSFACMYECPACVSEEGVGSPDAGVTDGCGLLCSCQEQN